MKQMKDFKIGFTLAEVLITLGIIGVVAAMTIPTLMANIKGMRNRAQFKKTLSTLNQAVRMNKANYGWDFSTIDEDDNYCEAYSNPEVDRTFCAIWYGNMTGVRSIEQYEVINESKITNPATTFHQLADGTVVAHDGWLSGTGGNTLPIGKTLSSMLSNIFEDDDNRHFSWYIGFIDVNGELGPNKFVECSGDTKTALDPEKPCVVKNSDITDIFPVIFHDDVIEPVTNAAKYVLNTAK
ncbi:type II secretion system protein [bacterium]|nr:type II secretion system protein [bacterium]